MSTPKVWMIWFGGAIIFFFAAMLQSEQSAVHTSVGVVFLALAAGSKKI